MDFDIYTKRPLAESLACEIVAGAVTALVACWGGRALMNKQTRELSPMCTLVVAAAGLAASWAATVGTRRALMRLNP